MAKLKKQKKVKKKLTLLNIARSLIVLFLFLLWINVLFGDYSGMEYFILPVIFLIFLATLILTWKKPFVAGVLFILEGIIIGFIESYELGFVGGLDLFGFLVLFLVNSLIPVISGIMFLFYRNKSHLKNKNHIHGLWKN
jgi:glucan phosphoethanolaminetransferase (alkaline phosphatase superfamily)